MMSKETKEDDELLDILEQENKEASRFQFEEILNASTGSIQSVRGLITKLDACPNQDFSVSDYSHFRDDRWELMKKDGFITKRVLFNSELEGSNYLKKLITYHLMPAFNPFGTIRSFESTQTYAFVHSLAETYIFKANALTATPKDINLITAKMLNTALDSARDDGAGRHYHFLFFYIRFWLSLSDQYLIPKEYCLDVTTRLIDTKERHQDIINEIEAKHQGWKSYTESDLANLINYALFWTEKAIPVLLEARNYLESKGIPLQKHSHYIQPKDDLEFENIFGKKIDGIKIIGFTKRVVTSIVDEHSYSYPHYYWKYTYALALDRVRNGLFILIALITGMRRKELGLLTFTDVFEDKNGEWFINITRFKTTIDPNFFGETEAIPLPDFIGEMVKSYEYLRNFSAFMRNGLLFQPVSNSHEVNVMERMIGNLARNLRDEVGVDSVHTHRFRKTIAEILIHRSERNIDVIRMLFGHKSYKMTLRYIARNPYLVSSIVEVMEEHFTADFVNIVSAVRNGKYSGPAAERLASIVNTRSEFFTGKILKYTIFEYVSYLLEAGEPLFIQRTTLGTYCLAGNTYTMDNPPPCLVGRHLTHDSIMPDPSNCQLGCENVVVTESAKVALEDNVAFYSQLLTQSSTKLSKIAEREYRKKIKLNEIHLANLNNQDRQNTSQINHTGERYEG